VYVLYPSVARRSYVKNRDLPYADLDRSRRQLDRCPRHVDSLFSVFFEILRGCVKVSGPQSLNILRSVEAVRLGDMRCKLLHSSHDAVRPRKKSLRIGKDSGDAGSHSL
jgi:hypothetical protein